MLRQAYRWFSGFVDDVVVGTSVVLAQRRGFSRTRPGPPPFFEDLLAEIRTRPPRVHWPERLDRSARVPVDLPHLGQRTFFDLAPSPSTAADTLIVYHHGLGEIPHDLLPRCLALGRRLRRCDWIFMRAVRHGSQAEVSAHFTADRDRCIRYLLASAVVARMIAKHRRSAYRHLVLCGTSLGGVITLIEACRSPHFDLYVPFLAGPDLEDLLLRSAFSRVLQDAFRRQERRTHWFAGLDLAALLQACPGPPILPLLARSDRLFRHPRQVAAYARIPRARITTFEGGHITGAANLPCVGRHLATAIQEVRGSVRTAASSPGPLPGTTATPAKG